MVASAHAAHRLESRTRAALGLSLVALLIHLVPLALPRKVPEVELQLARRVPDAQHRVHLLVPLLKNPQANAAHLRDAAELVLDGSPEQARRFLAGAERLQPGALENALLGARICWAESNPRCVNEALQAARKVAPQDPAIDLLEAQLSELDGDVAGMLGALRRAHLRRPADRATALRLSHALAQQGRVADAERILASVRSGMTDTEYLLERGLLLTEGGWHEEARRTFEAAAQRVPSVALPHYYLGVTLFRLGDWNAALAALRKADLLDPSDYRPLALVCVIHREEGALPDAAAVRAVLERRFGAERTAYDAACPP